MLIKTSWQLEILGMILIVGFASGICVSGGLFPLALQWQL